MAAIRLTSRFVHRCFCYHVVNCHDDPGYPNRVVVDVCKADATNALGMAKGFEAGVSGYGEDVSFFNENAVGVSDYGSAGKYRCVYLVIFGYFWLFLLSYGQLCMTSCFYHK